MCSNKVNIINKILSFSFYYLLPNPRSRLFFFHCLFFFPLFSSFSLYFGMFRGTQPGCPSHAIGGVLPLV